jgi:hypothetical protein
LPWLFSVLSGKYRCNKLRLGHFCPHVPIRNPLIAMPFDNIDLCVMSYWQHRQINNNKVRIFNKLGLGHFCPHVPIRNPLIAMPFDDIDLCVMSYWQHRQINNNKVQIFNNASIVVSSGESLNKPINYLCLGEY